MRKLLIASMALCCLTCYGQEIKPLYSQLAPHAEQLRGVEYVIPELIIGGDWTTTMRFTNRGTRPVGPLNVFLVNSDGSPLRATFQVTSGAVVTDSAFNITMPVGTVLEVTFVGPTIAFGHAFIGCNDAGCGTQGLYGEVALRNHYPTRPDFESIFPFEAPATTQYMLFDGRNGLTTTLYVVNNSTSSNLVSMDVLDTKGNLIATVTDTLASLSSQLYTLHAIAPQTIGIQGTLVFRPQISTSFITVTALRINPTNSFTPVRAFVPAVQ